MIDQILRKCLTQRLKIPQGNFQYFNCVLAIPDLLNRREVKHYLNLTLKMLGFKSVFIHQESVLATFGCNKAGACVVDIGSSKINVSCVEDG
jgi:actin-related protein 8